MDGSGKGAEGENRRVQYSDDGVTIPGPQQSRPVLQSRPRMSSSLRHSTTSFTDPTAATGRQANKIPTGFSPSTSSSSPMKLGHMSSRAQHFSNAPPLPMGNQDWTISLPAKDSKSTLDSSAVENPTMSHGDREVLERTQSQADTPRSGVPFKAPSESPKLAQDLSTTDTPYAGPDLYSIVLRINADPRMHVWWKNVTNVLQEFYHVERAVLSIPVDATDIQNVPWALRASYGNGDFMVREANSRGLQRPATNASRSSVRASPKSSRAARRGGIERPALVGRHSYAGHENTHFFTEPSAESKRSPRSNDRGTRNPSHDARTINSNNQPDPQLGEVPYAKLESFEPKLEDGSIRKISTASKATILNPSQPLESEREAIVEPAHINRVLNLNKSLVLTRSYLTGQSALKAGIQRHEGAAQSSTRMLSHINATTAQKLNSDRDYEEVEQALRSPWSNSPAPSPAIQVESEENPFFASSTVSQEAFSPKGDSEDYTLVGSVEAIGIDNARTVIHLPLFHPTFSDPQLVEESQNQSKVPIAILSVTANVVPYPQILLHSMKQLATHLATSYNTSCHLFYYSSFTDNHLGRSLVSHSAEDPRSWHSNDVPSPSRSSLYSKHSSHGSPQASPLDHGQGESSLEPQQDSKEYFAQRRNIKIKQASAVDDGNRQYTPDNARPTSLKQPEPAEPAEPANATPPSSKSHHPQFQQFSEDIESHMSGGPSQDFQRQRDFSHAYSEEPQYSRVPKRPPGALTRRTSSKALITSGGAEFDATFNVPLKMTSASHSRAPSTEHIIPQPSEKLLRIIVDAAPIQMMLIEPVTGKLKWFNYKFVAYHGYSRKELLEDPHRSIHPADKAAYLKAWKLSLSTGHAFQRKARRLRFDGEYLWFFTRAVALRDSSQVIVHWLVTTTDINDHYLAEMESAKQKTNALANARYRGLADSCPQITFTATRSAGITLCNNQWFLYSGQTEDQALGTGFLDHVHFEDLEKCKLPSINGNNIRTTNVPISVGKTRRKLNRNSSAAKSEVSSGDEEAKIVATPTEISQARLSELADTGILQVKKSDVGSVEYVTEVRLRNSVGVYRWHMVKVVLADAAGSTDLCDLTWFGSCSDIHDHKELAIQLKHAMEEKSRFLSNMSHEMRTPLNGINGNVNLMSATSLSDEQADFLNAIRSSAEGLLHLVNDVLDFSKAEAGMMTLQLEEFHLRSIVEDVNDTTAVRAMEKGLELNFIVDENVPVLVTGDKGRLRQVLWNIVNNALKFTSHGEVLLRCEVVDDDAPPSPMKLATVGSDAQSFHTTNSSMIQFTVSDTGIGFGEEDKSKLFQRFSQIDGSSTRQHGGTGLGLVISKVLVELHGGTMSAEGQPGKGAQFMFSIKVGHAKRAVDTSLRRDDLAKNDPSDVKKGLNSSVKPTSGLVLPEQHIRGSPKPFEQHLMKHPKESTSSNSLESGGAGLIDRPSTSPDPLNYQRAHSSSKAGANISASSTAPIPLRVFILCALPWAMQAVSYHVRSVIPVDVPVHILQEQSANHAREILVDKKRVFTQIILLDQETNKIVELVLRIFACPHHHATRVLLLCDPDQKRVIKEETGNQEIERRIENRQLSMILKPVKPSKLAPFFDPEKSRETSFDHNQHSAQQTVQDQRELYVRVKDQWAERGVRVLIVEDNIVNVGVIRGFFRKVNIPVEVAYNGEECLQKLQEHEADYFSIVFCDLQMPKKDGMETCRELRLKERNEQGHLPIVALSANVLGKVAKECEDVGFDHYLEKPIDYAKLAGVMTSLLGDYKR